MADADDSTETAELLAELTHKLGLPLPQLVGRGLLPENVAERMAENCTACANPAKCRAFLAERPDKVEKPPAFCVNARLLTFLCKTLPKA